MKSKEEIIDELTEKVIENHPTFSNIVAWSYLLFSFSLVVSVISSFYVDYWWKISLLVLVIRYAIEWVVVAFIRSYSLDATKRQRTKANTKDDLYYVQCGIDHRGIMYWQKGAYEIVKTTADINNALKVDKEEAKRMCLQLWRPIYPCAYIDNLAEEVDTDFFKERLLVVKSRLVDIKMQLFEPR